MFGSVKKAGRMRGFCLSLFSALNFFSNWRMDIKCQIIVIFARESQISSVSCASATRPRTDPRRRPMVTSLPRRTARHPRAFRPVDVKVNVAAVRVICYSVHRSRGLGHLTV